MFDLISNKAFLLLKSLDKAVKIKMILRKTAMQVRSRMKQLNEEEVQERNKPKHDNLSEDILVRCLIRNQ